MKVMQAPAERGPQQLDPLAQRHETAELPRPVYPGHPLVIALHIMRAYPSYEAANAPTEEGWCAAVGDVRIRGSGDHVTAAMHLLGLGRAGASVDDMIEAADTYWRYGRAGGHEGSVEPGIAQAELLVDQFRNVARAWLQNTETPSTPSTPTAVD